MRSWATLLLVWLCSSQTSAEGTPRDWFERMVQAAREQNYEGVLVYGNQRHWDSMAVRHAVIDGQEYEHLQQLTGAPREQIRQGSVTDCLLDDPDRVHPQPLQNPLHSFLSGHDFSAHYVLTLGDAGRVAGRFARQLWLQPTDSHRYTMRLWVDQKTALLLRSDLLDERHQVLERFQFAHIDIGADIPLASFVPGEHAHRLSAPVVHQHTPVSWSPGWLPPGFEPVAATEHGNVIRLMYADGVAAFSLFIDAMPNPLSAMDQQWGATSAVVRVVRPMAEQDVGESRRVTAVGELPAATLVRIVQSVAPVNTPEAIQEP